MVDFNTLRDHGDEQGRCSGCRWWQAERATHAYDRDEIGLCMHQELTRFSLQMSSHGGCNRFEFARSETPELVGSR